MHTQYDEVYELSPLSEMPIWARLQFAEMIPNTYAWDENYKNRRRTEEAIVEGFRRVGDIIWIHFLLSWDDPEIFHMYVWPAEKYGIPEILAKKELCRRTSDLSLCRRPQSTCMS